jgi:protein-L-isoaspartate O-methyltransferase
MMANAQITTTGYAREATKLAATWESVSFAELHRPILHLVPSLPCTVLDIGAGTGRDAAAFAAMGHRVVAVEPIAELRASARELHSSDSIEWVDDDLPNLAGLMNRRQTFDVVMLTAVWMHLDAEQRPRAMRQLAALLKAGGTMIMSLRHGPLPAERRMFDVGAAETIALAQAQQLETVLNVETASMQPANRLAGVTWSRLAFVKSQGARELVPRRG